MLTAALILSLINTTYQWPPLLYQPSVIAIQPTTGALLRTLDAPPCTWAAYPPEGEISGMPDWATVCRTNPPFTPVNSSTELLLQTMSPPTNRWASRPLNIPPFTSTQGARLRWTSNAQSSWLLVTTPAPGSPASGGGTAGNGGAQVSSLYAIPTDASQPTQLAFNSTEWAIWDIDVNPTGLYALAQRMASATGGPTIIQSAILRWPAPPLTPDQGGGFEILPGTLQARYLQAFLAPTSKTPLLLIPSSSPYAFEQWTLTDRGAWAMNQTTLLRTLIGQPIQIIPPGTPDSAYTIVSVRSIVSLKAQTESLIFQLPLTPPLAIRSVFSSTVEISPSPTATSTQTSSGSPIPSQSISSSSSASISATATSRLRARPTESSSPSQSSTASPSASTTSILVPVYYTPSLQFTLSSTPTPANAPIWPSPTSTFTPTSAPRSTSQSESNSATITPSSSVSPLNTTNPASNSILTPPTLTPGDITGISLTLILFVGGGAVLLCLFRNRVKNYVLARGWRKAIPRWRAQPQRNSARAPRPASVRGTIQGNPVFVSNPSFQASLTPEQKEMLQEARAERTKKAFLPMKSQGALV